MTDNDLNYINYKYVHVVEILPTLICALCGTSVLFLMFRKKKFLVFRLLDAPRLDVIWQLKDILVGINTRQTCNNL